MEHKPVKSSNIESVGYDSDSQKMQVKFSSGHTYEADEKIPAHAHRAFMGAHSLGGHFARELKSRYNWKKL